MRVITWIIAAVATQLLFNAGVRADEAESKDADPARRPTFDAGASARQGMLLPVLVAPGSELAPQATVTFWAGYDSARESAVMRTFTDVTVYGPFALRAGISYLPDSSVTSVQPHIGARVQLLSESRAGFDLGVGVFYRMERFTEEEGLAQALLSGGVHFGNTGLFANLSYGQDLEGDDREAEVAVALLHAATSALQLGLEARSRFDLASDDPKRGADPKETFDASFAPTASYAMGPIALSAQVGPNLMYLKEWRWGVLAMGGLGGAF